MKKVEIIICVKCPLLWKIILIEDCFYCKRNKGYHKDGGIECEFNSEA